MPPPSIITTRQTPPSPPLHASGFSPSGQPPVAPRLQWLQIPDGWTGGGGLREHFLPLSWLPCLPVSPLFQLGLLFHPDHLFSCPGRTGNCQEERSLQRFKRREGGAPLGKVSGTPRTPPLFSGVHSELMASGGHAEPERQEQNQETKTNLGTSGPSHRHLEPGHNPTQWTKTLLG